MNSPEQGANDGPAIEVSDEVLDWTVAEVRADILRYVSRNSDPSRVLVRIMEEAAFPQDGKESGSE